MIKSKSHSGQEVELLGPSEAAAYCEVSSYLLNKFRREGWIPPNGIYRVGTGYLYSLSALNACKEALRKEHERIWEGVEVID